MASKSNSEYGELLPENVRDYLPGSSVTTAGMEKERKINIHRITKYIF